MDLKAAGMDEGAAALLSGVHAVLSRCLHTLTLFKAVNLFHEGVLPQDEPAPGCGARKFRLLFLLERPASVPQRGKARALASVTSG